MATVYDVPQDELVLLAAEELKKVSQIKAPEWALFVKTGMHKERPPIKKDWWYVRAASVLKYVYKFGPIGTSKLKGKYGGRKSRGHAPPKSYKGSGSIVREVLQQLDSAGLTKQIEKGQHKGRVVTPKGKSLLDKVATQILAKKPKIAKEASVKSETPSFEAKPKKEAKKKDTKQTQAEPAEDA